MFQKLYSFLLHIIYFFGAQSKEAGYKNFWFSELFEHVSNIWYFYMSEDGPAEDGPKKSELECKCNNKVTNLETWALGKYTLACNSESPCRNLPSIGPLRSYIMR